MINDSEYDVGLGASHDDVCAEKEVNIIKDLLEPPVPAHEISIDADSETNGSYDVTKTDSSVQSSDTMSFHSQ